MFFIVRPTKAGTDTPPSVVATITGDSGASTESSFVPTLPTGSGGTLLLFTVCNGNSSTMTTGSTGWTLVDNDNDSDVSASVSIFAADGNTSAPTIDLSSSQRWGYYCMRLNPVGNIGDMAASWLYGSGSNSPNPTHDPGLGAREQLWIVARVADNQGSDADAQPSGFTGYTTVESGAGTNNSYALDVAHRAENSDTLAPGAWDASSTSPWATLTVNVPGAVI